MGVDLRREVMASWVVTKRFCGSRERNGEGGRVVDMKWVI